MQAPRCCPVPRLRRMWAAGSRKQSGMYGMYPYVGGVIDAIVPSFALRHCFQYGNEEPAAFLVVLLDITPSLLGSHRRIYELHTSSCSYTHTLLVYEYMYGVRRFAGPPCGSAPSPPSAKRSPDWFRGCYNFRFVSFRLVAFRSEFNCLYHDTVLVFHCYRLGLAVR